MSRVRLVEAREDASSSQVEVWDHIAATRGGRLPRPYAAMLHRPDIARATADLGAVIRYSSELSDHDRELIIVATAIERSCRFEWEAHRPLAIGAGVDESTLRAVETGDPVDNDRDAALVELVRSVCRTGAVEASVFDAVSAMLGEEQTVETAAVVGFYSMLAVFMNTLDVC